MQLNITFRQMDPSDSLKEYIREKVEKANKFLDVPGEAHVVLSLERHLQHADITLHSGRFILRGREKSEDMYASIDLAVDKIEKQLLRYKDRLKHHHGRDRVHHRQNLLNSVKFRYDVVSMPSPEQEEAREDITSRVIRTNEFVAHPMTVEDAVMQMDLMNNDFLVFTNAQSLEVNVVYRRKDGHYGLIEAAAVAGQQANKQTA